MKHTRLPEMVTTDELQAVSERYAHRIDRLTRTGRWANRVTTASAAALVAGSIDGVLRDADHGYWLPALFVLSTAALLAASTCMHWTQKLLTEWGGFLFEHLGPPPPELAEMMRKATRK